ncbi:kinase-like domain-containing protein [Pholiota molesta]|nr:kinase-like domain-containing protein [Pholiota molesta]
MEQAKLRMVKRGLPTRRSQKVETLAYGHGFVGCGQQSDYEATTKLGEGTFGEVHKAIHKSTGTVVALKRILMHNEKEGMPVTALREIKILKALKHPCIVNILDMFVVRSNEKDPLSVYMVFPYMDHDLAGLLENERVKLQPSHIKLYMKQLLEGTEYMHRNHILHRDMKAANLLISNNGTLRIADFGLARTYATSVANAPPNATSRTGRDRRYTNCVVTRWYRPPELLLGARNYGGEVDMWGIGCVLGEMFQRKPILPGTSDLDQLEKIFSLCGSPNQHNWPYFDALPGCEGVIRFNSHVRKIKNVFNSIEPETVDLLDKLLVINPKQRITAAEALEHDYFWSDPLPADPKSMPSYEASHEYDKRGHRNHPPMPAVPPMPAHVGNQQRHPPPLGNQQQFNRGGPGPRGGPPPPMPPHNYPPDLHKRGMNNPPPYHLQQQGPPGPHPLGPPPPHQPHPDQYRHGPPPPPGAFNAGHPAPPWPSWPPGAYPPPNRPPPPPQGDMPPRNDRRDMPPRNNPPPMPSSRLPPNPNLPPRPAAPLGTAPMDERYRVGGTGGGGGGGGYNERRSEHPPPPVPDDVSDGPPGGVLNYG